MSGNIDNLANNCVKQIADLLVEGKFKEAFELLDQNIEKASLDFLYEVVIMKYKFHSTNKAFRLSLISWDQYQIDNSKLVKSTIDFAVDLCFHLALVNEGVIASHYGGDGIIATFSTLIEEINALEPK